jgi:transcription antitermination factor NusG
LRLEAEAHALMHLRRRAPNLRLLANMLEEGRLEVRAAPLGGWEQPRPVDEAVIAAIRERENKRDRLIHYYRFRPQEAVVVRAGPLKDLYGIFERYVDEGARVRILLSLVGYQAAVELEAELVAKV